MFSSKVKVAIDKSLYQKLAELSQRAGYATVDEFVVHVLEREAAILDKSDSDEAIEKRLRGLGYIE